VSENSEEFATEHYSSGHTFCKK